MDPLLIARINELAKLQKTVGLTAQEKSEQATLRGEYLREIRAQFRQTLENVRIETADGEYVKPQRKEKSL